MSYENPTPLKVGAAGTLNGWRVQVAGRLVLGVQDGGETYFWNEFHLRDDAGNSATLVFEETESGPEWKVFREFSPSHPLSARDAASKKVGDTVNLDGTPIEVTLVGSSRVFHIEGVAPEGVENGDIATYFNADTGSRMLVASWTGEEIEFYEGLDAPPDAVADAFGFPRDAIASTSRFSGSSSTSSAGRWIMTIVLLVASGVTAFGVYSCFSSRSSSTQASEPRPKLAAPAFRLQNGAQGSLAQHSVFVDGHALVEVARVSGRHDRHEYILRDGANQEIALLVNGLSGGAKEWHLLWPVTGPPGLTPYDAATKRNGSLVNVEGSMARIVDLYQSKAVNADGPSAAATLPQIVRYGFVARDGNDWVIARWTEDRIQFHRGAAMPETEVISKLGSPEK
jgi:hypothetical protein